VDDLNRPGRSQPGQLLVLRIIWFALILGQVMFLMVTLFVGPGMNRESDTAPEFLFYMAIGMAVLVIPVGFLMRGMIYARGRQEDGTVAPGAYATGNIIFFATCEAVGMFAITGALINGGRGPHLIVAAVAIAILVLAFPTGKPLRESNTLRPMDRGSAKRS
jgi:hypothetical protein